MRTPGCPLLLCINPLVHPHWTDQKLKLKTAWIYQETLDIWHKPQLSVHYAGSGWQQYVPSPHISTLPNYLQKTLWWYVEKELPFNVDPHPKHSGWTWVCYDKVCLCGPLNTSCNSLNNLRAEIRGSHTTWKTQRQLECYNLLFFRSNNKSTIHKKNKWMSWMH